MADIILPASNVANIRTFDLLDQIVTVLGSVNMTLLPLTEYDDRRIRAYRPGADVEVLSRSAAGADADILHSDSQPYQHPGGIGSLFFIGGTHLRSADAARFSFGDAAVDSPFSVGCWFKKAAAGAMILLSKYDDTPAGELREWRLYATGGGVLAFDLFDESVDASEIATAGTALPLERWQSVIVSYDGAETDPRVFIYLNGGADNNGLTVETGAYEAMENTAAELLVGTQRQSGTPNTSFAGRIALPFITGRALTATEAFTVHDLGRRLIGL